MSIIRVLIKSAFVSMLVFSQTATADTNKPGDPTTDRAVALLETWDSGADPGVAVAITFNGKLAFSHGVGLANLEYDIPIKPDTVFHAASIAKQFTAFAIMLLKVDGKLSLEDDIRDYLPAVQRSNAKITIQHLLNHTSGFREFGTLRSMAGQLDDDVTTQTQIEQLVFNQKGQNFDAGARVEYSNTGYFLLAKIVEQVSGQPFSEFMQERVFLPLGMHNTQFYDDRHRLIPNRAYSYARGASGFIKLNYNSEISGSTGIQTTVLDLLKWSNNFVEHTVGSTEVVKAMASRSAASDLDEALHANGQELRPYRGLQAWSHGGRDAGFRAFLIRVPDQQFAVAVLSNRADFDAANLAFKLTDLYLPESHDQKTETWKVASQETLEQYAGNYELYSGTTFSISVRQSEMYFSTFNSTQATLLPQIGPRRFSLNADTGLDIEFNLDANQRVDSLSYIIGQMGSLKARKVTLIEFDKSNIDLQQYVGHFYSEELQSIYAVHAQDDSLVVSPVGMTPISLTPYQPDTFVSAAGNFPKIQFLRDKDGAINRCLISGPLADDIEFKKISLPK